MKWKSPSRQTKRQNLTTWHEWFAWHPVRIGEEIYWLERVQRKCEFHMTFIDDGGYSAVEYKTCEYQALVKLA